MSWRCSILPAMALAALGLAGGSALAMKTEAPHYELKPGQELTIPIRIADGQVVVGAPRLSRLGWARPGNGEIVVGLEREKGTLYDKITATEKTATPIDFVATGLIGDIKIDERVICGRLDGPSQMRIGSVSWRIVLRDFELSKGDPSCP